MSRTRERPKSPPTQPKKGVHLLHNKEYKTVALRVAEFRAACPDSPIITTILQITDAFVLMRAEIFRDLDDSRPWAVGHSQEFYGSSAINRTGAVENAETSAIGRALAALGLSGEEFASADEIRAKLAYSDRADITASEAPKSPGIELQRRLEACTGPEHIEAFEAICKDILTAHTSGAIDDHVRTFLRGCAKDAKRRLDAAADSEVQQ